MCVYDIDVVVCSDVLMIRKLSVCKSYSLGHRILRYIKKSSLPFCKQKVHFNWTTYNLYVTLKTLGSVKNCGIHSSGLQSCNL